MGGVRTDMQSHLVVCCTDDAGISDDRRIDVERGGVGNVDRGEFARVADADRAFDSRVIGNFQILYGAVVIKRGAARAF